MINISKMSISKKLNISYAICMVSALVVCVFMFISFILVKNNLEKIMDPSQDSIRFYFLGNNWKRRVEHTGIAESYDPEGILMI